MSEPLSIFGILFVLCYYLFIYLFILVNFVVYIMIFGMLHDEHPCNVVGCVFLIFCLFVLSSFNLVCPPSVMFCSDLLNYSAQTLSHLQIVGVGTWIFLLI